MRIVVWLLTVTLMLLAVGAPAWARAVRMETTVALGDPSEPSVKQALREAFDISVRGALAMGFKRMRVDGARVLPDAVVLAMIATDDEDDVGDDVVTQ
jgi:hypothetical protein